MADRRAAEARLRSSGWVHSRADSSRDASLEDTITLQIAQGIDLVLGHLSASVRSLGEEYSHAYARTAILDPAEKRKWLERSTEKSRRPAFVPQPKVPSLPTGTSSRRLRLRGGGVSACGLA